MCVSSQSWALPKCPEDQSWYNDYCYGSYWSLEKEGLYLSEWIQNKIYLKKEKP